MRHLVLHVLERVAARVSRLVSTAARVHRNERGNIAILGALTLPVVAGGLALGAETGYWYFEERKLQSAADLSAHAGGVALRGGGGQAVLEASALDIALSSGFDQTLGNLTLNSPPVTGGFAGDNDAVEVTLDRQQRRFFSRLFIAAPFEIGVRAVAQVTGGSRACLLALSPNASGAVTVSGSSEVRFSGCDIAANSNANNSFLMSGGAAVVTTGCVHTVGGVSATGNLTLTDCATPNEQAPVTADPYAGVAEPSVAGTCQPSNTVGKNNQTTTVSPIENHPSGVKSMRFCGGLSLRGTVDLDPGLYIVDGGDFELRATTVARGTGVTFLLVNGARAVINGSATLNLAAPTTGPLSGIILMGSRADSGVSHQINGNAASRFDGAVYAPNSNVDYSGNFGGSGGCTQIVVNTITFTGNSELAVDCQAAGTRDALVDRQVRIVE
ncbi:pilus assembly protein TadG-related protein [uncultured Roseobacter sp.]|uniref:pilus assembly protein TadG-related protein n=1 Tax=uncultured Roseobacter sp. TaxID=114847 RepID=UPI002636BC8F|nr:pilus assembly protein TadG-related protein [uncultured Roseobacter sp.]